MRIAVQSFLQSAASEVVLMTGETRKHWMEFCERAAVEQDPQKLILLAREINRLLQEKQDRISGSNPSSVSDAA